MHACTKPDTVEQTHPQERITSGLFLIHCAASNRQMKFTHGNTNCWKKRQPLVSVDKTSANHLHNPHFSLCCVQSCQLNHEETVQCVSKSRINVMIWPIKL